MFMGELKGGCRDLRIMKPTEDTTTSTNPAGLPEAYFVR